MLLKLPTYGGQCMLHLCLTVLIICQEMTTVITVASAETLQDTKTKFSSLRVFQSFTAEFTEKGTNNDISAQREGRATCATSVTVPSIDQINYFLPCVSCTENIIIKYKNSNFPVTI